MSVRVNREKSHKERERGGFAVRQPVEGNHERKEMFDNKEAG